MTRIPARIVIVQGTLPHYRLAVFEALLAAATPGSLLIHGDLASKAHGKMGSVSGHVPFARRALMAVSPKVHFRGKMIKPVWMPGLYKALVKAAPDAIITEGESNLLNNFAVSKYARRHGVPYIWWGLGQIPGARPSGLRRVFGGLLRRMIAGAAGVACYSSYARDFYLEQGANPDNCRMVGNALDYAKIETDMARFGGEAVSLRADTGVGKDDIVLLTVGSLEKTKRIELVLRALSDIRKRAGRRVHFWIVGDGEARQNLEDEVAERGLEDVIFFGRRHEGVSRYFLAADLFVLPGLGGLALNHAMAHGLPVIAGPADGTEADLLGDGTCGQLLEAVTPQTLAGGIVAMVKTGKLEDMGAAARLRVTQDFTIERMINTFSDLVSGAVNAQREG